MIRALIAAAAVLATTLPGQAGRGIPITYATVIEPYLFAGAAICVVFAGLIALTKPMGVPFKEVALRKHELSGFTNTVRHMLGAAFLGTCGVLVYGMILAA